MNQLYAIRAYGGSYDDAWETTKFVTDDRAKGEAYCAKMNAYRDKLVVLNKEINEWNVQWRKINTPPVCPRPESKDYPRWDSKTKVTPEMRAERKRIQDENNAALSASTKPYVDWNRRCYDAWMAWQEATYSVEDLEAINHQLHDTYWDIEPVDWLE